MSTNSFFKDLHIQNWNTQLVSYWLGYKKQKNIFCTYKTPLFQMNELWNDKKFNDRYKLHYGFNFLNKCTCISHKYRKSCWKTVHVIWKQSGMFGYHQFTVSIYRTSLKALYDTGNANFFHWVIMSCIHHIFHFTFQYVINECSETCLCWKKYIYVLSVIQRAMW